MITLSMPSLPPRPMCTMRCSTNVDSGTPEQSVKTWMVLAEFVGEWRLCPALRPSRVSRAERGTGQFHPFHEELVSSER